MKTFEVQFTQVLEVSIDETLMNEEFMKEFRVSFYPFFDLEKHAKHIARLYALGIYNGDNEEFVEGYGKIKELGVNVKEIEEWTDVNWAKEE